MKKAMIIILVIVMFVTASVDTTLAEIDLSSVRNNEFFDIDINSDGNAFITLNLPDVMDRVFYHKYSLDDHPSFIYSDIIILDYFSAHPSAAMRIWFNYSAARFLGITSISITIDNKEFTFTGMGSRDKMESNDGYVTEYPNILLGHNNTDFITELLSLLNDTEELADMSFPVVLHGSEDIETEIEGMVILEMCFLEYVFFQIAGVEELLETDGTAVTVRTIEQDITDEDSTATEDRFDIIEDQNEANVEEKPGAEEKPVVEEETTAEEEPAVEEEPTTEEENVSDEIVDEIVDEIEAVVEP